MSKLIIEMAPICPTYDVDPRLLREEHKLAAAEDLSKKVDLVLADPPYNIRREWKDENAVYDVSGSGDMKEVAKVLGEVMKPEARAHVFCSALQFDLWYKALASEKREKRASTREDS